MGSAIVLLLHAAITIMTYLVLAAAVCSWLIAFDVINVRNPTMYRIVRWLDQVTEPLLRPIRRFVPPLGGMDLSPIIFLLLLQALDMVVMRSLAPRLMAFD